MSHKAGGRGKDTASLACGGGPIPQASAILAVIGKWEEKPLVTSNPGSEGQVKVLVREVLDVGPRAPPENWAASRSAKLLPSVGFSIHGALGAETSGGGPGG